jgi:serine/threonine-protein kinase
MGILFGAVAVWLALRQNFSGKREEPPATGSETPAMPVAPSVTPFAAAARVEGWPAQMSLRYPHLQPLQKVKAGGAGTIFLVQNARAQGRRGAVKILHDLYAKGDNPDSQRFLAEPKVLSRLKDLGIAPQLYSVTYDLPGEDAVLWYEMEWLENFVTLRKHVGGKGRRLPETQLPALLMRLTRGVARMHQRGIVHRDLTPENLMVGPGLDQLRLVDFGLVRFTGGLEGDDLAAFLRIDEVKEVIGKPSYCAPEQWLDGLNAAREPSDWFSVGAIFWEMIHGTPPYRRPEEVRSAPRIFEEMVAATASACPLDRALVLEICHLLDPNPDARTLAARRLADML